MSSPYLAEIRIFAGNFAPHGWATCDGQLLPISQNTALFSLLGTFYGGNGTSNFALPNMQGRGPMHFGQGAGLTQRVIGETGGEQNVTLIQTEMPQHTHTVQVSTATDHLASPNGNTWGTGQRGMGNVYAPSSPGNNVQMDPFGTALAGGNLPHNNLPPYLVLTFIIAQVGIYPSRN
jgi:microcystin-dependent protein